MPDALTRGVATYLGHLHAADERAAVDLVTGLIDAGADPVDVLVDVIATAQRRVGELWQSNAWNVAQEHAATHISDRAVAAVAARTPHATDRGSVVVSCLDQEFHALPARIVAEVLRLAGWRVTFLGASVPAAHLTGYLHQHNPDVVALSCAVPLRLPVAHAVVESCRRMGTPVVVGGRGFGPQGRWARALGITRWAADARAAVTEVEAAVVGPAEFGGAPGHLADDEYRLVVKRRAELVDAAVAALTERFPAMAGYSDVQLRHTVDDLGYIVDFLAAAVYVDDPELFTGFLHWLADVLDGRSVPLHTVDLSLGVYRDLLYDFPRAAAMMDAGRDALRSREGAGPARKVDR
ncbi:cobalamin-binding protein [Virgisporangium aliadipatigenens]|uniref:Cobalamin-binding protein n=1 Tax=Virgisporangium aliadipatigenens TaxID=741659 RepID=A0A8J4DTE9_9ACTN|nr:cobalamin-dependent protein [Virgisporangium aliadipatigenens]GIJ48177.1 cobalamin-binding protein [Virgisporangium aliadipatigenens]